MLIQHGDVGLTAAELGSWSAATAALLTAECGLVAGDRVAVLAPPHWQTAVVLLGAWSAGMAVSSLHGWDTSASFDATFVERGRVGGWLDAVPSGRHQFVLGAGSDVPAGYRDFVPAARGHLGAPAPAWDSVLHGSAAEYGAPALELAAAQGIRRGDRVRVDVATASAEPLMWLLAPLAAGASIMLS